MSRSLQWLTTFTSTATPVKWVPGVATSPATSPSAFANIQHSYIMTAASSSGRQQQARHVTPSQRWYIESVSTMRVQRPNEGPTMVRGPNDSAGGPNDCCQNLPEVPAPHTICPLCSRFKPTRLPPPYLHSLTLIAHAPTYVDNTDTHWRLHSLTPVLVDAHIVLMPTLPAYLHTTVPTTMYL